MNSSVPDGWKLVKLDDVADETSDRVDNPCKSGYDRFVGLDHLDSGELTVHRWGSTADLLSAMKLFKSGDILIGRRNAYLKRASKAEFDGVCSGDAYVVREKKGKIAEGLLPIILNSDSFWDYTIAHASGTMSKRAKWRDLAEYSFLLPPPEEQRRISTTLWAAEDCIVKGERFVVLAERAKQLLMRELFSKGIGHKEFKKTDLGKIPHDWEIVSADKIAKITRGRFSHRPRNDPDYYGGNIPFIQTGDVVLSKGLITTYSQTLSEKGLSVSKIFPKGTMVMTIAANIGYIGIINFDSAFPDSLVAIYPKDNTDKQYLRHYFVNEQPEMDRNAIKGTQKNINVEFIKAWLVKIPPLPEQRQIAAILTRCDDTIAAARANVGAAKALKMKMINEMLRE